MAPPVLATMVITPVFASLGTKEETVSKVRYVTMLFMLFGANSRTKAVKNMSDSKVKNST